MKQIFALITIAVVAMAPLVSSSPVINTAFADRLKFDSLLDGSLGNMPALFLVSQGALLEVHAAASPNEVALAQDPAATATASAPPSTQSAGTLRTGKEDGAALGVFISSMIVPTAVNIAEGTLAGGICKSLVAGVGGMLGAVVGQEARKIIYPNGTTNTSASELEQGIIPGTFIGGIAGNSVGTALSKTLCTKLVSDLEKVFQEMNPDAVTKMSRVLNRGLTEVLTAHLKGLSVKEAKAVTFAHQLESTLQLADKLGMPDAFDFLNRKLAGETADLARAIGRGYQTTPAINSLVQLSTQTLSMGLPWGGSPFSPGPGPTSALQTFTDQYKQVLDFGNSVPGARKAAGFLSNAVNLLHNGSKTAAEFLKNGSTDDARLVLDGAAEEARGVSEITAQSNPDNENGRLKVVFKTETVKSTSSVTVTLTAINTKHLTSTHTTTTTSTALSYHGACASTATVTEHTTGALPRLNR
ncbi:hypothetical protein T440DRAFT_506389 [Plenodomus tracheiphilus IPT5]|uniref:Uncharacterized protein n=1 Tax=Plenodomus tracheiphilus IPT5 TaxID=1408161 RepID=A0A6A7BCL2_9PLEO|nr:hypothetical protein T440DRAFT_506389 [Plenodomus tracheiphilus IPT5]